MPKPAVRQQHNKLIICNINNSSPKQSSSYPLLSIDWLMCGMSWAWASISSQRWRCTRDTQLSLLSRRSVHLIADMPLPVAATHSWQGTNTRARTNKGRVLIEGEKRRGGNSLACVASQKAKAETGRFEARRIQSEARLQAIQSNRQSIHQPLADSNCELHIDVAYPYQWGKWLCLKIWQS